jgi:hypothetical protein
MQFNTKHAESATTTEELNSSSISSKEAAAAEEEVLKIKLSQLPLMNQVRYQYLISNSQLQPSYFRLYK